MFLKFELEMYSKSVLSTVDMTGVNCEVNKKWVTSWKVLYYEVQDTDLNLLSTKFFQKKKP